MQSGDIRTRARRHRAGKDAEGKTGDGVGILLQISHKFFKKIAAAELGITLGEERDYAVGMFFFPQNELARNQAKKMFEIIAEKEGLEILGWRVVPAKPEVLGTNFAPKIFPDFWRKRRSTKCSGFPIDISLNSDIIESHSDERISEDLRAAPVPGDARLNCGRKPQRDRKMEERHEDHQAQRAEFCQELDDLLKNYAGRPSLLYYAEKMTKDLGGAKIYLKREDLNHTGAHKINNVLGQCLLAKRMGKTRVIAETGAGQHGVATATAAALMGLECEIFMGKEDTDRQALNVYRMELLGAKVNAVTTGTMTLKDAVNEAMREWVSRVDDTHYVLGSVMGPHPFPTIVRDFQAVISKEAREQILEKEGKLPKAVMACVGGGSNAMGMFYNFINDKNVRLIGCEAAGRGVNTAETAATIATGTLGVFHGMKSYFCQDKYGQIAPVYSISAGLDYPGIGPEHAYLHDIGRAEYVPVTDDEAVEAFEYYRPSHRH